MSQPTRRDPKRNDPTVASNIRRFRMARGISQSKLAEALGLTFQQVQKYEKATNAVPSGRLRQICTALDITPGELYETPANGNATPAPDVTTWAYRTIMQLDRIKNAGARVAIAKLIATLAANQ